MFNLIYILLGIYAIKILLIRINMEYCKRKNITNKEKTHFLKSIYNKFKKFFNEKTNIFIFRNNKSEEHSNNLKNEEEWNIKRHMAMEKAKYKCEECGNITNLDVYNRENDSSSNELVVLCKRCYEKDSAEVYLHYE